MNVDKNKTSPEVQITIGTDISVVLTTGEEISAQVVAPRLLQTSFRGTGVPRSVRDPVIGDFAVLKLQRKPKSSINPNPLLRGKPLPSVGSEVIFSGYPLESPTMLTHKGMISGITEDQGIICIQAPINKGNSGGSLLNEQGEVIGIITNREGGVSKGLAELTVYIRETQKHGRVELMGVNPLGVIEELIKTLDMYISPGIGYARTIKYVGGFIQRDPEILK